MPFFGSRKEILLFKVVPRHNGVVLSSVPKHKKAMTYLVEKICVLDKLGSDMSYSATWHEFSVNESTTYIK